MLDIVGDKREGDAQVPDFGGYWEVLCSELEPRRRWYDFFILVFACHIVYSSLSLNLLKF